MAWGNSTKMKFYALNTDNLFYPWYKDDLELVIHWSRLAEKDLKICTCKQFKKFHSVLNLPRSREYEEN